MKAIKLLLVLLLLLVFTASVSDVAVAKGGRSHSHFRSHLGFSFAFGPYWGPWGPWYNSYPVVVVELETPVYYIEKSTADASQPAPQENYWYFCSASEGYYPYVKECPGGWYLVPPRPAGQP